MYMLFCYLPIFTHFYRRLYQSCFTSLDLLILLLLCSLLQLWAYRTPGPETYWELWVHPGRQLQVAAGRQIDCHLPQIQCQNVCQDATK